MLFLLFCSSVFCCSYTEGATPGSSPGAISAEVSPSNTPPPHRAFLRGCGADVRIRVDTKGMGQSDVGRLLRMACELASLSNECIEKGLGEQKRALTSSCQSV